jgi:hypothetical protein
MKYFLSFDNDVSGPYEVPFIAQLYQQGIIDQESLLMADDDTKEWKPLVEWLPSVAALQTTASLLKKLTPAAATPAIECEKYVTRMRGASSYKALRGCMNISLAVCVVILAMISIAPPIGLISRGTRLCRRNIHPLRGLPSKHSLHRYG